MLLRILTVLTLMFLTFNFSVKIYRSIDMLIRESKFISNFVIN